jgi:hypothetical protein
MSKTRSCLVYWDGGDDFRGIGEMTQTQIKHLKNSARNQNQAGYLSGYRVSPWSDREDSDMVIVFFEEKPTEEEILRRRKNGFKAAKWHWL